MKTFRNLSIGQEFDFISGTWRDSLFLRCRKVSTRCYVDSNGIKHKVGSINAEVYHVSYKAPAECYCEAGSTQPA